jgi:RNA polymerase-binding transcription factor DksA
VTQTVTTSPSPVQSLDPLERLRLRDLLQDAWRDNVEQITALAVKFHSIEADRDTSDATAVVVAGRLADLRLNLTEIEAAMHRMDLGGYGRCARCDGSIPFEDLTGRPHRRACGSCEASKLAAALRASPVGQV